MSKAALLLQSSSVDGLRRHPHPNPSPRAGEGTEAPSPGTPGEGGAGRSPASRLRLGGGGLACQLSAAKILGPIALFLAGFPALSVGAESTPEDALRAFYGAIAAHDCEKAAKLADGYSADQCRKIERLTLDDQSIVRRRDEANKVSLEYGVSLRKTGVPGINITNAEITLNRYGEKWIVDFSSLQPLSTKYYRDEQQLPTARLGDGLAKDPQADGHPGTIELHAGSKPAKRMTLGAAPASIPEPVASGPSVGPPAKPSALLDLWTPDELRGKPGDERIKPLSTPDFRPPLQSRLLGYLPPVRPDLLDSIRRGHPPEGRKWVALTFDLCEQADEITGYDRSIVNTLRDKQAKATFYAGGKWMQSHPEKTMQLMADPRFEIGNHGWTHGNLRVMTGQRMRDQIVWTQAEYGRIREDLARKAKSRGLEGEMQRIPAQPETLRFPYGTCSPESLHTVNDLGLGAVQWDVVSGDPGGIAPTDNIVRAVRSGSIIVFHANGRGRGTAAALPKIIDGLRAKGFEFVTVSEMLHSGKPEAVRECYENKPGDNLKYDREYGEGTVRVSKQGAVLKKAPSIEKKESREEGL